MSQMFQMYNIPSSISDTIETMRGQFAALGMDFLTAMDEWPLGTGDCTETLDGPIGRMGPGGWCGGGYHPELLRVSCTLTGPRAFIKKCRKNLCHAGLWLNGMRAETKTICDRTIVTLKKEMQGVLRALKKKFPSLLESDLYNACTSGDEDYPSETYIEEYTADVRRINITSEDPSILMIDFHLPLKQFDTWSFILKEMLEDLSREKDQLIAEDEKWKTTVLPRWLEGEEARIKNLYAKAGL